MKEAVHTIPINLNSMKNMLILDGLLNVISMKIHGNNPYVTSKWKFYTLN